MTEAQFTTQLNRLAETFGKAAYGTERARLIWFEVKDLDATWFMRSVDELIGTMRQAPLMTEFREKVSIERERLWKIEKDRNAREAKAFMRASFGPDDRRWIIQTIIQRGLKEMPDDQWDKFVTTLDHTVMSADPMDCGLCEDTGLVWAKRRDDHTEHVFRCQCRVNANDGRRYPTWGARYESEFELGLITMGARKSNRLSEGQKP